MDKQSGIRFAEYMEDFETVVLIGFEKSPDFDLDRKVEALGGVVLEETGRVTEREPSPRDAP